MRVVQVKGIRRQKQGGEQTKMSLEDVAASQQRICNVIAQVLPAEWQRAWVQIEHTDESCAVACFYSIPDTALAPRFMSLSDSLFAAVSQLRRECRETSSAVWSIATLILEREKFGIEYGYDPVPIEGEIERRRAWKKKYLPQ